MTWIILFIGTIVVTLSILYREALNRQTYSLHFQEIYSLVEVFAAFIDVW